MSGKIIKKFKVSVFGIEQKSKPINFNNVINAQLSNFVS